MKTKPSKGKNLNFALYWPDFPRRHESAQRKSFRAVRCAMLAAALFLIPVTILSAQAAFAASSQTPTQASQFESAPASASHMSVSNMSASNMSLSLSLQEWGNEFGMGFQITSPWFIHQKVAVRLGGSALWKQDANWTPYYALRGGLVGANFMRNEDIRLYGVCSVS